MRKWKHGDLLPWKGRVVEVRYDYGEVLRLWYPGDPKYYPELDVSPAAIAEELHRVPAAFVVGDLVKRGGPWYGITKRYWSTKRGMVLYDLLEFGAKEGHRMSTECGVPEEELEKVWP